MEGKKNKFKLDYQIILLYLFLFLGGLWHILGYFEGIMSLIAGYTIITLSIINVVKYSNINEELSTRKYFIFVIIVIIGSFVAEYIGVKTGIIFGPYIYGNILQPQINEVPVAIGFAWILVLLNSKAVLNTNFKKFANLNIVVKSVLIGLYMTIFDVFMEPASIKLDYWHWFTVSPPLQNYIAWFVFGFLFSLIGYLLKVMDFKDSKFSVHSYFAQIIYFILIYFS